MAIATFKNLLEISTKSAKTEWQVVLQGDDDIQDAAAEVAYESSTYYNGVNIGNGSAKLIRTDISVAFTGVECDTFKVYVTYSQNPATQGTTSGWVYPESDETMSIQTSIQTGTVNNVYMAKGGHVVNEGTMFGAAGYSENGFQINAPKTIINVRKKYSSLPDNWMSTIAQKTGKINNAELFGFPIGSLMFIGVQSAQFPITGITQPVELTFQYDYQAPTESFTLNGMTVAGKKGWEQYNFVTVPHLRGQATVDWAIDCLYEYAAISPISVAPFPTPL